ncbi:S1 family peptidase [Corynebacterium cystitidis]|uniref:S1 family peptidase n=1 Tax=Corynebacterium cystitidis TaxID=35757 RepID=UPI00211DAE2D|nr:S1 family peptidase [Corynebacterium cystitidis]
MSNSTGRHRQTQGHAGAGLTLWSALAVVTAFVVAIVAWLGITTHDFTTPSAEEAAVKQSAQTPPPVDPNVVPQSTVLTPASAPWAPGTLIQLTDFYPQPGQTFTAQSCTVAFSFTGEDGRAYAVTAGHCGKVGDLVWPTNATHAEDYRVEAGTFIYSGMQPPGTEGAGGTGQNIDIGIIEITDPSRAMEVVGDAIPTGLVVDLHTELIDVCKTGGTTGYTCGQFGQPNQIQLVTDDSGTTIETRGDLAQVCAAKGDSGGPVFTEVNGRAAIIGVVSGTEAGINVEDCATEESQSMLMSYTNMDATLDVIRTVVPDAALIEQPW